MTHEFDIGVGILFIITTTHIHTGSLEPSDSNPLEFSEMMAVSGNVDSMTAENEDNPNTKLVTGE